MTPETKLLTGLALSLAIVYWTTPLAIRVADRFEFYDARGATRGTEPPRPISAAQRSSSVFCSRSCSHRRLGTHAPGGWGCRRAWAVGTIDDRRNLAPGVRVLVEVALATVLWRLGASWELGFGAPVDWAVSVVWVVAVVNAFNLFDNMDGAASSMACVVSGALALLGIVNRRHLARRRRCRTLRRLCRLPTAQPRLSGADLPWRWRQHADRLRRGDRRHDWRQ